MIEDCLFDNDFHYPLLAYHVKGKKLSDFFKIPKVNFLAALDHSVGIAMNLMRKNSKNKDLDPDDFLKKLFFFSNSSTANCNRLIGPLNWHYNLELAILFVFGKYKNNYLGIIKINNFQSIFPEFISQIFINTYLDGRIVAYNQNLPDLLGLSPPQKALGLPLDQLVHQSLPAEDAEDAPDPPLKEIPLDKSMLSPAAEHGFSIAPTLPLEWENIANERFQCLNLIPPVDHDFINYRLSFDMEIVTGVLPYVILRADEHPLPDTSGYLFGPIESQWTLKKNGIVICRSADPTLASLRRCRLLICKTENVLTFIVNGRTVLRYHERYPHPRVSGRHFSFYVVENSICRVSNMTLHCAVRSPVKEQMVTAYFKNIPHHKFRVHQVPYYYRDNSYLQYQFEETTIYHRQISHLEKEKARVTEEKQKIEQVLAVRQKTDRLVGQSGIIRKIKETLEVLATSADSLLLCGETGTGKEVIASLFHELGANIAAPYIKLDCSTLPASLLEAELFGYEPGAFTGAVKRHIGRFEQAQNGTLFLDEIANLSLETQARLLGVLDDFKITRLGSEKSIALHLRVVTASNQPLEQLIKKGLFRKDLLFRLNRFKLEIPPLRQRLEDLPLLCQDFMQNANAQYRKAIKGITEQGFKKLFAYSWPGNVRELQNVINRAVLFAETDMITVDHLLLNSDEEQTGFAAPAAHSTRRGKISAEELQATLEQHGGNIRHTALILGVSRLTIYNLLKRFGLTPTAGRHPKKPG
ncbi:MAG: sigma-54 dependent transcriptional regulator [Fibrobacterota bacterium]